MQIAGTSSSSNNVAVVSARQPIFHSPDRLIVGNAPLVGVLDLPGSIRRPPIRLYFPAATTTTSGSTSASSPSSPSSSAAAVRKLKPAKYFVNNRVAYFLQGFAHLALARHTTKVYRYILRPLVWLLSLIFPARYLKIPGTVLLRNKRDANVVKYLSPESLEMKQKGDFRESDAGEDDDGAPSMQAQQQQQTKKQRLIVFSHGLTGTGEENSIYCTSLAKKGYVVASLHHRDGSSCRVPMPDGTCRYYQHMPMGDDYDPHHRLEQVAKRAEEFLYCCDWLVGDADKDISDDNDDDDDDKNNGISESNVDEWEHHHILHQIRQHLDKQSIIAAGFSYGAATASLAATRAPAKFQCTILLDGWFHIDYSSRGIEYDFPPESFGAAWPRKEKKTVPVDNSSSSSSSKASGEDDGAITKVANGGGVGDCKGKGLDVPSLFINSGQFQGYQKLYGATKRLADQINDNGSDGGRKDDTSATATQRHGRRAEMHVIPGTMHQNFCDIIFWIPRRWGKKMFELGDADAYEAYENILNWTVKFLERF